MTQPSNPRDQAQSRFNTGSGGWSRGDQGETVCFGEASTSSQRVLAPGDTIGDDYILISLIGLGGMGVVYRARHKIITQEYALKILAPHQVNDKNWQRFITEARSIARLNNPNIVKIYNMGIDHGQCPYYVMELLHGQSMSDRLKNGGPFNTEEAIEIFSRICDGLDCAHKHGIIHRDIKPSNVMLLENLLGGEPDVKIVDFGIARLTDRAGDKSSDTEQLETGQGEVFGSPYYMSPEQCQGLPVDERSDIYSFGCTLFEALTGRPPFSGDTALQTLSMHITAAAPTLAEVAPGRNFNPSLQLMLQKALQKDPRIRYQTMHQVQHDFTRIREGKPISIDAAAAGLQGHLRGLEVKQTWFGAFARPSRRNFVALAGGFAALAIVAGSCMVILPRIIHKEVGPVAAVMPDKYVGSPDFKYRDYDHFLQGTKPFARDVIGPDGRKMRQYNFWTEMPAGAYSISGLPDKLASGIVTVPADTPIKFYVAYAMTEQAEKLLAEFGPDDICALRVGSYDFPAVINIISKWRKLDMLAIKRGHVAKEEIVLLDKLKGLRTLELQKIDFNLQDCMHLKLIPSLEEIHLIECEGLTPFLTALRSSTALRSLTIDDIVLSDLDLESITRIKNLNSVTLFSTPVSPATVIASFSKMRQLKKLIVLKEGWKDADLARLKKTVPFMEVVQYKTGPPIP